MQISLILPNVFLCSMIPSKKPGDIGRVFLGSPWLWQFLRGPLFFFYDLGSFQEYWINILQDVPLLEFECLFNDSSGLTGFSEGSPEKQH